jgi:hypothetical protein
MATISKPAYTADEALARLVAGNERFTRGEARFPTVQNRRAVIRPGSLAFRDTLR